MKDSAGCPFKSSTHVLAEEQNELPMTDLPLHALLHAPGQPAQGTLKVKQIALSPARRHQLQCPPEERTWMCLLAHPAHVDLLPLPVARTLPSANGELAMFTGMGDKQIDTFKGLQVWRLGFSKKSALCVT